MEDNNIRRYAKLMQELGLSALSIKEDGCEVRLERGESAPAPVLTAPQTQLAPAGAHTDGCVEICSPMIGIFYASPAENATPYVKIGDRVKKGDVLCIIEAMKLMNEICSDYDGVVDEVCVTNGKTVDYGYVLFRLKKESE